MRGLLGLILGALGAGLLPAEQPAPPPGNGLVVEAPAADTGAPLGGILDRMIVRLTGAASPREAWARVARPTDRVGIKVSASAAPAAATKPDLLLALLDRLESAGVRRSSIVVWDRSIEDLERAGLTADTLRCRVVATEGTYDPETAQFSPLVGKLAFGDLEFRAAKGGKRPSEEGQLSSKSHYARLPARELDRVITLLPLLNHESAGISGALYHLTAANIDNWRRFLADPHAGDPFLAELYYSGPLRAKASLHILDARHAQFAGGPGPAPHYTSATGKLFMAADPVALDTVAAEILDTLRAEAKLPPASARAKYLETAAQFDLGTADRNAIRLENAYR